MNAGMIICCCVGLAYAQQFLVQASYVTCNLITFLYDSAE